MTCRSTILDDNMLKLGFVSVKPKLGRGQGSVRNYKLYHKDAGFAYSCRISWMVLYWLCYIHKESSMKLEANISQFAITVCESERTRSYYIYFKTLSDLFVFKTFLAEVPSEYKENNNRQFNEPIFEEL